MKTQFAVFLTVAIIPAVLVWGVHHITWTKRNKMIVQVMVASAISLFAWFIWPTRYKLDKPDAGGYEIRHDRFSGESSYRVYHKDNEWMTLREMAEELAKNARDSMQSSPSH